MAFGVEGVILTIFRKGLQGDVQSVQKWIQMYHDIYRAGLPASFFDLQRCFKNDILDVFGEDLEIAAKTGLDTLNQIIQALSEQGILQCSDIYSEYSLVNHKDFIFYRNNEDCFFVSRELQDVPLQAIRSRVDSFCRSHKIAEPALDEIIISVTEAAENAVKYSDRGPVYIEQKLVNSVYEVKLINSTPDLSLASEIDRGKFSEEVSLMRGVLVMSKLLDHLNIERNSELSRVEFIGSKKLA